MRQVLERWAESVWYGGSRWWVVLWPLSVLYQAAVALRWNLYRRGWLATYRADIPVIVVGNITAGGAGKTPLVIRIAELLKDRGIRPGILLRGYGKTNRSREPLLVNGDSEVDDVGDEALMIFARLQIPVCVCAVRSAGSQALEKENVDVIVCDDGLQHYALERDLEIAVVDSERKFGNGHMIPAGPLREKPQRLARAQIVVTHSPEILMPRRSMRLCYDKLQSISGDHRIPLDRFSGMTVDAVAGIGNPGRFFAVLRNAGLTVEEHRFPDHHNYTREDLRFAGTRPLLMTEKDAVKCYNMDLGGAWYLPVDAQVSKDVERDLFAALRPHLSQIKRNLA
ncbi:MAG: tetraacyldisaccharide 4'-kinase [Gammaproteobacteria bacterium]|nr:tetraacyldisaccharide 4'-kinase [Gammaproteobacteria bacterium]NNF15747.1 tetraacyldisaccharide 4'-kinase [Gammaproteobacteria bacterium]